MPVAYGADKLWGHWQKQHFRKAELLRVFYDIILSAYWILMVSSGSGVWENKVKWSTMLLMI